MGHEYVPHQTWSDPYEEDECNQLSTEPDQIYRGIARGQVTRSRLNGRSAGANGIVSDFGCGPTHVIHHVAGIGGEPACQ
jgi:hypothetical protein